MRNVYLAVLLLLCFSGTAFGQLYEVSNTEKEQNATLIVEGKVVDQTSFWNPQHTMIFTSSKIKVYKVFKGENSAEFIHVLTQGGTVGDMSVHASELLELNRNQIGVFFCFPNTFGLTAPNTGNVLYDVYASSQGFFKYDIFKNIAGDPFNSYSSIDEQVYPLLTSLTKRNYEVVDASFDIKNFQAGLSAKTNGTITSFSPATVNAGATLDPSTNLLTINGTGFGSPSGSAAVIFTDGNTNNVVPTFEVAWSGPEVVSWTDTKIMIRVPTRAATGGFEVRDASGGIASSPDVLRVNYSILTANNAKQYNLINANGLGGYTQLYSTNMTPEATTTFNRALRTWVEVSGLNVIQGGTTGTAAPTYDNQCVVAMDPSGLIGAGVLGVCYSYPGTGSCGLAYDTRRTEYDILLRSSASGGSATFSYGPCAPASNQTDLESVLIHEIGHGLNLGHINDGSQGVNPNSNPGKIMHYAISSGMKRVSPDYSSYYGSLYAINGTTTNFGPCTSQTNMVPLTSMVDAKDDIPASFPVIPTPGNITVNFDLEHATSNKHNDPPYNVLLCSSSGTNVTNNLYLPIRTANTGTLSLTISDLVVKPTEATTSCLGSSSPTFRIALYQLNTPPTSPNDYSDPVACRSFIANGAISTITGLTANTNYLMYVDGKANAKASFKITLDGTALPLKLTRFVGEVKGSYNQLTWAIETFSNVAKLVLEKSANGTAFSAVYTQTEITTNQNYNYDDHKPFAGKNYYRLATYNKDGSIEYSNIVVLNREERISVSIYPNPVKNDVRLNLSASEKIDGLEVKIFSSTGQLIATRKITAFQGLSNVVIPVSNFAAGIYRVVLSDKQGNIITSEAIQKL